MQHHAMPKPEVAEAMEALGIPLDTNQDGQVDIGEVVVEMNKQKAPSLAAAVPRATLAPHC